MRVFAFVDATPEERRDPRPGDELVVPSDVVMDRAFTVPGDPDDVFPWLEQLGKGRAGWYLPRTVERVLPPRRRALRRLAPHHLGLAVGDVVPDYGGPDASFTVAQVDAPRTLVYRSERGRLHLSWSIVLRPVTSPSGRATRVLLRLRMGPVRRRWLALSAGEALDRLTIAGMAAGLHERLSETRG